jgi:hypothetical protein
MKTVRMPKIGSIFKRHDGTCDIGPIPDLGGPFDTATAFFRAWAARAKFPTSEENIRKSMGGGPSAPLKKCSRPSRSSLPTLRLWLAVFLLTIKGHSLSTIQISTTVTSFSTINSTSLVSLTGKVLALCHGSWWNFRCFSIRSREPWMLPSITIKTANPNMLM